MERSKQARTLKERAKRYIPLALQKQLYKVVKKARFLKHKHSNKVMTKEDLKEILRAAGLKENDMVVVHSSLGRIGYVENGAKDVIDAFLEIIGKKGLLAIPCFPRYMYNKKYKMQEFDVKNTPAYTGAIPETFRKLKGVKRSISPTHSYCAFGTRAEEFVSNHENCDNPFSMEGPFGKMYNWNAKIFLIGIDQLANTPLHIVENRVAFPLKLFTKKFKYLAILRDGKTEIHTARRHLDRLKKIRDPNILEKYCLQYDVMKIHKMGKTELRVLSTKNFIDMYEKLVKRGITIYCLK